MKRLQIAAIVALLAIGLWLVAGPALMARRAAPTPGASALVIDGGGRKLRAERVVDASGDERYHFVAEADDLPIGFIAAPEFWGHVQRIQGAGGRRHVLLTALNVSSWWGVGWVAFGFVGQLAFFGRMAVQWIASERAQRSVVPPVFWWLSLVGGMMLFTYFVWRKDPVGVMGQSAGVVIYTRNLALLRRERAGLGSSERDLEADVARDDAPSAPGG